MGHLRSCNIVLINTVWPRHLAAQFLSLRESWVHWIQFCETNAAFFFFFYPHAYKDILPKEIYPDSTDSYDFISWQKKSMAKYTFFGISVTTTVPNLL